MNGRELAEQNFLDVAVARRTVEAPSYASHRQVALADMMTEGAACS